MEDKIGELIVEFCVILLGLDRARVLLWDQLNELVKLSQTAADLTLHRVPVADRLGQLSREHPLPRGKQQGAHVILPEKWPSKHPGEGQAIASLRQRRCLHK